MTEASRNAGEHIESLTGAYALDALDELDRARVDRHLAECETCAAEVRSFSETVGRLGAAAARTPPTQLRARVLDEVRQTRQLPPPPAKARGGRGGLAAPTRWLAVAAAGLLVLGVAAGAVAWQQAQQAERAQQLVAAVSEVLTDPQRLVADADFADGQGTVMASGDRVVVIGKGVDAPAGGRTFQLWFIGPGGPRPSELLQAAGEGTFWVDAEGLEPGDAVGVTVEPAGGSQEPTSDPVLVAEPAAG
jgi:anti-sigma-K factor RskA